jgi:tetratricopeptide (TPR) repeat protein
LALCSKEIALIWFALFALHALFVLKDASRRTRTLLLLGALGVIGCYAGLHALPGPRAAAEASLVPPFGARVLLMVRALGDYARLMVFPSGLHMERVLSDPGMYASVAAWQHFAHFEWLSVLGFLVILATVWLLKWRQPGGAVRWFGAIWFAVAFLPISNLFPLNAEVAEHWIYLASIGALIFLAGCIRGLPARWQSVAAGFAALAFVALGLRSFERSGDWVDAETFYRRTIAADGVTPRILISLGSIYGQRGDYAQQEAVLRRAAARYPAYVPIRASLGVCLTRQGRAEEARQMFDTTQAASAENARRFPRSWSAVLGQVRILQEAGQREEALRLIDEAQPRFPDTWELLKYGAELRRELGRPAEALPPVERYAAKCWWHLDAWLTLAELRLACGRPEEARTAAEQASRLDIYDPRPLMFIAELEMLRARPEAALTAQLEAFSRKPDDPRLYLGLAQILQKLGREAEAVAAVRKAQTLAAAPAKATLP